MAVSLISTGVQFPDNSIQTSAASGGGAWTYLSTVTASSVSTADMETTFDSTYDMYAIIGINFRPTTNGDRLGCRMKVGGTYQSTDLRAVVYGVQSTSATMNIRASNTVNYIEFNIPNNASSDSAAFSGSFIMYVPNPASTTSNKRVFGDFVYIAEGSAEFVRSSFAGVYTGSTSALTGIQFRVSSSTMSGTFRLYGIKNS